MPFDASVAAILVPGLSSGEVETALDEALGAARYARRDGPLPPRYTPADGEWLGIAVSCLPAPRRIALVVPEHLGEVFQIARWVSRARPGVPLAAFRCYRGLEPVVKFLLGGEPRWRDGPDADLEVAWEVPTCPAECQGRVLGTGLPASAAAASELLEPVLAPYARMLAEGARARSYVARGSPLASGW